VSDLPDDIESLLIEEVPYPVAVVDEARLLVAANVAFRRVFGAEPGTLCHRACCGTDEPADVCVASRAFVDGETCDSVVRGTADDGRSFLFDVRAVPLPGADGEVARVALVMSERSRIEELEERLRLAERLATVGLTAGGLAHTIKNILGGLDGAIYTLDSGLEKGDLELTASAWEVVQRYLDQISVLVRNLLDYARDQEPRRQPIEPAELVDRVVELFEDKGSLVGVTVEGHVEAGLPSVEVDPQAIGACLANLVTNAMDACQWDPDLDKEHGIQVRVHQSPVGGVVFEVRDNGAGISPKNQGKVLASSFTTKGLRGTGLGLLLTRKAVEQHGGAIRFDSTPGQGTTFQFELPARVESA